MANIFDDKNIRIGTIVGGLVGTVAPIATAGDKLTVVDVVIGAVVVGAIGLGIGFGVTSAKRQQLLDNESKVKPSQSIANESNIGNETPAVESKQAENSPNPKKLIAWLAVTFIVAYSLVPRSELENRTVLASLLAPDEAPKDVSPKYETVCYIGLFGHREYTDAQVCRANGGEWRITENRPFAFAQRVSPPDVGEVVSADFEKALPFLVIIAGILGASIFISSRSKKRAAD